MVPKDLVRDELRFERGLGGRRRVVKHHGVEPCNPARERSERDGGTMYTSPEQRTKQRELQKSAGASTDDGWQRS